MAKRRHYSSVISRLFGRFARHRFPAPLQRTINRSYVKLMGLRMEEFKAPEHYPSLNALFTRALEARRKMDPNPAVVIAPCDALISDCGAIQEGKAYQIKGMSYDTAALLGEGYAKESHDLEGGAYVNFYLSPRDYHRYHAPFELSVEGIVHIPGKLYPVNMPLLKHKLNLFIENERVVIATRDREGRRHFLILVGALNVGKMLVTFEPRIHTNASSHHAMHYRYEEPKRLKKGELFGWFEMGSTIVILSEKGSIEYDLQIGSNVAFAQSIGHLKEKR